MKVCVRCKIEREDTEFSQKSKNKKYSMCDDCYEKQNIKFKICKICGKYISIDKYSKTDSIYYEDGYLTECKECVIFNRENRWSYQRDRHLAMLNELSEEELEEYNKKYPFTMYEVAKKEEEFVYADYLKSELWQAKREIALARAGYKCQLCSKTQNLNVHHNTYDRIGKELETDLVVLCRDCHAKFHDKPPTTLTWKEEMETIAKAKLEF